MQQDSSAGSGNDSDKIRLSQRGEVEPFRVMDVLQKANQMAEAGHEIVHWEVGQPSTAAPAAALEKLATWQINQPLGYGEAKGYLPLRERIRHYYQTHHQVDVDLDRVQITTGSSGAFQLSFIAAFDAGDDVALTLPCYPSYRNILKALNINVRYIDTQATNGFQPTLDEIKAAHASKPLQGLMIASPSNPVGSIINRQDFANIAKYCEQAGIQLISDEIYHRLEFGASATSALALTDKAIVINSFSKFYSMTGWRIGWMIMPAGMTRRIEKLAQNFFICPPMPSQLLAAEVFAHETTLETYRQTYATNRELLLTALKRWNLTPLSPDGAFYCWVNVAHLTADSEAFCQQVLSETGIAMTAGRDFDPINGHEYIRIAYPRATEQIQQGIARLDDWFAGKTVRF